jgi:hypothetical protein
MAESEQVTLRLGSGQANRRNGFPDSPSGIIQIKRHWGLAMVSRLARRDFLKVICAGSLWGLGGWGMSSGAEPGGAMDTNLLEAIEASDGARASALLKKLVGRGVDPWKIHLSLFPVVQRVLNPPFINPHLPKMHGIYRELVPSLNPEKIADFVSLEIMEYARRPKMEIIPKAAALPSPVAFKEIESAVRQNDPGKAASLMGTFLNQQGGAAFARELLFLGSGYLNSSLGHSVSCTAFILLEMLERTDMDPWPALSALASYFCKGQFHAAPALKTSNGPPAKQSPDHHLFLATSGRGIVNLHHTITRYAIERVRKLLTQELYTHMMNAWIDFEGDKNVEAVAFEGIESEPPQDYDRFYENFSTLEPKPVVASARGMIGSEQGRDMLRRYLVRAVCDLYQGDYDPHYVTGLGSAQWVLEQYWQNTPLVMNALFQYVDYLFTGLRRTS